MGDCNLSKYRGPKVSFDRTKSLDIIKSTYSMLGTSFVVIFSSFLLFGFSDSTHLTVWGLLVGFVLFFLTASG